MIFRSFRMWEREKAFAIWDGTAESEEKVDKHQKIINRFTATIRWWTPDENFPILLRPSPFARPSSTMTASHMGNQNVNILSSRKWKTNWTIIVLRFAQQEAAKRVNVGNFFHIPKLFSEDEWKLAAWASSLNRTHDGAMGWIWGWKVSKGWEDKVNKQNVELSWTAVRAGMEGSWQSLTVPSWWPTTDF